MSVSNLYPTIAPSLSLDFANVKALDPRITFTRASTAAYYDGVTTAKAEENLFTYSQEFDNAAWTASDITKTANTEVAPDGTTTADTITENSSTAVHNIIQSITAVIGDSYTFSVFAKRNGRDIQLCFGSSDVSGNPYANFDLATGAVGTTGGTITASISSAGNSWYRCSVTVTSAVTTSFGCIVALIDSTAASRLPSYAGDNSSGAYLWGAQLEQRSAVSAYTPTTTQPITNYIPVLQTAASGVARFDHNPTTGESLGLLVEEQRTNLQVYSQEFDNAAWALARISVTANTIVAPDGTLTGDKLVEDTQTGGHYIEDTSTVPNNATLTYSFFAKAGERTIIEGYLVDSGIVSDSLFEINLATGTIVSGSNATITPVGNGWYRCSTYGTVSGTSARGRVLLNNGATDSYTGDGYSGIYIWGAQLEAGAFPTSYIPTTSASVTRAADAASMTGTNFSSWFNNAEGTLYAEAANNDSNTFIRIAAFGDATASNEMYVSKSNGVARAVIFNAGATQFAPSNLGTWDGFGKIALGYKVDDTAATFNGGSISSDTSLTIPNSTQLNIGSRYSATSFLNGTIKKLAYYPQRLTNAQLQALTT